MIRFGLAERRARLALRHGLAGRHRPDSVVAAARSVVALHATDPATVFLSAQSRCGRSAETIAESLYQRRELTRMLGMRRTLFAVPTPFAGVVQASSLQRIIDRQRTLLLRLLDGKSERWLRDVQREVLRLLAERPMTGVELSHAVPRLRVTVEVAPGKTYGGPMTVTSRMLLLLGAEGRIVRADPVGSWISGRHRWMLAEQWYGGALELPDERTARAELARSWLAAFGPAPMTDLIWWTGWPKSQVRQALADNDVVEADLDGEPGVVLADDLAPTRRPASWVALLPALDPTIMGWSRRDWFLGEHRDALFDRNGNAGPTVVADGRVVGGWAQRKDGEIAVRILEDIGTDMQAMVEQEAERLRAWLGAVRFTPRFRTPTEQSLTG